MKNGSLVSCEEVLKQYVQVERGDTLQKKFGPDGWRALVGPAKRYCIIYTVSDCLFVASSFPGTIAFYLAIASNRYYIAFGLVAAALIAQWTLLFYSPQAKPQHIILGETAEDRKLFMRLFFRFHRLAATGKIEFLDDEDPFGPARPIIVKSVIFRGDHGWLTLLGSERGNIRLKGIWLRRPPRNLKIDMDTLALNSEIVGELALIQVATRVKTLAEISARQLSALREILIKIECFDDILQNAVRDVMNYIGNFEECGVKEDAIRYAAENSILPGTIDGRMTRIRQLVDGKNQAAKTRLTKAVEKLSYCVY